ncbi:MAG: DUF2490 domain-containing protein [Bacteroidota bacterium]
MRNYFLFLGFLCLIGTTAAAQSINQNTGWLFLMNSTKITSRIGLHFDAQFRSSDEWKGLRNVLIRPGLTYFINSNNDLTAGYLFTQTYSDLIGVGSNTLTEHRAWEQYIFRHKLSIAQVSHRFRLEQRFLENQDSEDFFGQRFRYFLRGLIPLKTPSGKFEKGMFAAVQNEIFLNVQGKERLNGHVFDQNRAYAAFGYRFSSQLDVEAGYMNQTVNGAKNNTHNSIFQLAVYTRF